MGSTLVPLLLAKGHQVRVLDCLMFDGQSLLGVWSHPCFEFLHDDIRNKEAVKKAVAGIDAVVHLAAIVGDPACSQQPELTRAVNLEASLQLFTLCQDTQVSRFIFASTCSNYGKMADPSQLVDEDTELRPISLYAETKVNVERHLLDPGRKDGIDSTVLRISTVFGVSPRMRFDLTINEFTMEMATKKHLVVFGEQFWRPYIHVWDIARAISMILRAPEINVGREVFNLGSTDNNFQKQQLVDKILAYVPDTEIEYVHKDEDPRDYRVSFDKIARKLGFAVTRTVDDGIIEVLDLVRSGIIKDFGDPKYRNIP